MAREVTLVLGWDATDDTVARFARIIEAGMNDARLVMAVMPMELMLALNAHEVLLDAAGAAVGCTVVSLAAATMPA